MKTLPLIILLFISGCALLKPSGGRIDAPRFKPELHGALNEAAEKLGRPIPKSTIRVRLLEGDVMSAHRPWLGRQTPNGVATGHYWSSGTIDLYTTGGQYRPATAVHEFAHWILDREGIPWEQHHDIMRRSGIK